MAAVAVICSCAGHFTVRDTHVHLGKLYQVLQGLDRLLFGNGCPSMLRLRGSIPDGIGKEQAAFDVVADQLYVQQGDPRQYGVTLTWSL